MSTILPSHRLRLFWINRGYRCTSILLALSVWIATMGISSAQPATARPGCAAAHCIYLPIVVLTLPIRIISSFQSFDAYKATAYQLDGAITPTTSQPVHDVTLEARFYDAADQLIGTQVITPALAANLPGQHNRFTYLVPDFAWVDFYPARYALRFRTWTTTSARDYRPVTVVSAKRSGGLETGYISGVIRNDQAQALNDVMVLVEWDNLQSSYAIARIARLEPGATAPFEVGFVWPDPAFSSISPVVQGLGYLAP